MNKRDALVRAGKACFFREIEGIKIDLKDRRAAQVSRWSEFYDQFLERYVLVRECFQGRLSHAREGVAKSWIAREVCAQGEIIQKEPDQVFSLRSARALIGAPMMMSSCPA